MSTAETIEKFLIEELAADEGSGALDHDEDLLAAELIDSLGIQELVVFLERSYGIKVQDDDLVADNFRSVNAIVQFVEGKRG